MWKIIIFLSPLLFIVATQKRICWDQERVTKNIQFEHGYSTRTQRISKEVCCVGYNRNENGTCQPICNPECVMGECVGYNECACHENWDGNICNISIPLPCVSGLWGEDCEQTCDCNGSNCTISSGECLCQAGYTGGKCETSCPSGSFGQNCSESCKCLNGDCNPITGDCNCYPGYTGINCSIPCSEGKYGVKCNHTCKCQNNSQCNKTNGDCICQPGFQGLFCENDCNLGTWGINCAQTCSCGEFPCDPRTGNCYCDHGYTGAQCKDRCAHGFCGKQCVQSCNCGNGECSIMDCTCKCDEGWTGDNCTQPICSFMKHGIDCSKTCDCHVSNALGCDPIFGNCTCRSGWSGERCSQKCAFGYYGPNCNQKCSCKEENTDFCDNGLCKCKPGWIGKNCENACEPGFYGENCTSMCFQFGADNYICDRERGDLCTTMYEGDDCERCICEPHGRCNSTTGKCECNPGYFGNKCELQCSRNKYGKNCELECECDFCRKTDGYCKCQEGWKGTECSDYCPIKFYDKVNQECIEESGGVWIPWNYVIYSSIAAIILIFIIAAAVIYAKCTKVKSDGMINFNATKITLAPLNVPTLNEYERQEHLYETVSNGSIAPSYQRLFRHEEVPDIFREATYFDGYESPTNVSENIGMYTASRDDYVRLDRNSVGPQPPINDCNSYYLFKRPQLQNQYFTNNQLG